MLYRNVVPYVKDVRTGGFNSNPSFSRFPKDSPKAYVDLAYRCISVDATARPTFTEIGCQLEVLGLWGRLGFSQEPPLSLCDISIQRITMLFVLMYMIVC